MKDLGTVMRTLGQTPSQNEIMRIMEKQDTDRNGIIDFAEFLKIMRDNWKEPATQRDLIEAFKLIDNDGNGTISV